MELLLCKPIIENDKAEEKNWKNNLVWFNLAVIES